MKVTAIFDIGKTNKKFFLFDENFKEVHKEYRQFEEIRDEDGHPTENLEAVQTWIKSIFGEILKEEQFDVRTINFSTYGASFVHIDDRGQVVAPLYNYTKDYPREILDEFHRKYGSPELIARQTASPPSGMLNSGMQLYWLKYARPELFERIRWSLHFPQYLSYLFTGIALSDFTSIGCHTSLWDYEKEDYHDWVYAENIHQKLPPIVPTDTSINMDYFGRRLKIGVGIHDSSAALFPYMKADETPFLLLSTGTWSVALNPFSEQALAEEDLQNDSLHYMRIDGKAVRAARLFLGNEYNMQVERLRSYFGKDNTYHKTIAFDPLTLKKILADQKNLFHFESIQGEREQPGSTDLSMFPDFEYAFHQLMVELMELQKASAQRAIGQSGITRIYIDGGFADNELFIKLLSHHFPGFELRSTRTPLGSALGAALLVSNLPDDEKILEQHYAMKKHKPLILY